MWGHIVEATDWIGLGQLVVGTFGIVGVVFTLRISASSLELSAGTLQLNVDAQNQKTDADNRAHWWERYVWAEEMRQHRNKKLQQFGWQHLDILTDSPLATATEKQVIQLIALQRLEMR